jgi:hypothetical protein
MSAEYANLRYHTFIGVWRDTKGAMLRCGMAAHRPPNEKNRKTTPCTVKMATIFALVGFVKTQNIQGAYYSRFNTISSSITLKGNLDGQNVIC